MILEWITTKALVVVVTLYLEAQPQVQLSRTQVQIIKATKKKEKK